MKKAPIRISILYFLLGISWIFLSDIFLNTMPLKKEESLLFDLAKGGFYVLCTSLLLYYLIKRYNEKLEEREHQYKKLFEENPNPMLLYDQHTLRILAVNQAAVVSYGYSKQEFLSMTIEALHSQESRDSIKRLKEKIADIDGKYSDSGIWQHQKKNKALFYVQIFSHPTVFDHKKARLVSAQNVHEKYLADQQILQLNQQLREKEKILESITDGFFAVDRLGDFVYINDEFERALGMKREDLIGKNSLLYFPELIGKKFPVEYQWGIQQDASVKFEDYSPCLKAWYKVSAYPTQNGLAVYLQDVTEEKELRLEVERSEHNLAALINNTEDLIWSVNKEMRLLTANQPFLEAVSLQTEITLKAGDFILLPSYDQQVADKWQAYYQRALKGESFRTEEYYSSSGEEKYVETSFHPIVFKDTLIGVSCVSRDITKRKNYETKIRKQNQILKDIAHMQSHVLRRPVATIMGLIGLFDKNDVSSKFNLDIVDRLALVCGELDTAIHKVTEKTYELG